MPARYVVGIDLGTTNTVVAFAALSAPRGPVEVLELPQLVSVASTARRPLLPSLVYAPLEAEQITDPWGDPPWVKGELARTRGIEVPGRVALSAKSWLCHSGIDRTAPVLPWGAEEGVPKISPVDVSAALLVHVRRAWDAEHPDAPLDAQDVVLTVPASFDEVARELTVSAALTAGLHVRLLEEPQAAFYDYRAQRGDAALEGFATGNVLVCDVGGGTTDLSLFRLERAPSKLEIVRSAVGRHLLLGGDNMDLAVAHIAEQQLSSDRLDAAQLAQLVLACRAAKETLLEADAPIDVPVSVAGFGAKLVGGVRTTRLSRDAVREAILTGFFPPVGKGEETTGARAALLGFGLPYERDVAVTRHVAAFLRRHGGEGQTPLAILLNGGVFHSSSIVEGLVSAVEAWRGTRPLVLAHADPDLAVARGAVVYGLARLSGEPMITSGAARGYYVEVQAPERAVMCVVPRGTGEGVTTTAASRPLALALGRPARFELFASDTAQHEAGDVLPLASIDLDPLPPVFTTFSESGREESVKVALVGELSPIGTLDLACVELEPKGKEARRFRLAFNLRATSEARDSRVLPPSPRGPRAFEAAVAAIVRAFGKSEDGDTRAAKDLVRELERLLGERGTWTTPTARALFDALLAGSKARRRSLDHERVFWQLAGFCLRPGIGDIGDRQRVSALWKLFPEKVVFADQPRGWQQFWFAWRRVAAGLDEAAQGALRDLADPFLAPPEARLKTPKVKPEAQDAMLEMTSMLERVPAKRRVDLGSWLLERTWTDRDPRIWGALGRLGARAPTYASVSYVLAPSVVERWIDHLLREKWDEVSTAAEAAIRMSRITGDRARDVSPRVRAEVAARLRSAKVEEERVRSVLELVVEAEGERAAFFGEGMPVGLRLM
jgi:molecular chaperone DnaK (HSP70)